MRRTGDGWRSDAVWVLALTLVFELVTCLFRFGLRMESTRDTRLLRALTFGLRVHHGYAGMVVLGVGLLCPPSSMRRWCLRFGLALLLSDLAHHFLVLWPLTGDPQFHLVYPP